MMGAIPYLVAHPWWPTPEFIQTFLGEKGGGGEERVGKKATVEEEGEQAEGGVVVD